MMMNCAQCDMTNVSLDGDESLSQQPLSPGENMGDLVLPQLEERIETLKESEPRPLLNVVFALMAGDPDLGVGSNQNFTRSKL
jgi:hypothetical protein